MSSSNSILETLSDPEIRARAENKFSVGFHALMGLRFLEWEEGRVVIGVDIQPHHLNVSGHIHGGALATLMDVAGICAGTYCPYVGRMRGALTLTMTTTFTGQARGGRIRAIGSKRAGGSRIYNSTIDILDEDDNLLAIGEGTFRLRRGSDDPRGVSVSM